MKIAIENLKKKLSFVEANNVTSGKVILVV
jgi:hypothetical protein